MTVPPAAPLVLLNLDVLEVIFSYLAADLRGSRYSCRTARRTLLDLALLSRQLTEPALRVLWRSMDSLLPLLRLIPGFQKEGGQYALSGCFPSSWERWEYYAVHVREFKYLPPEPAVSVNPTTYGCISRLRGTLRMLPNLQSLFIDIRNASSLHDFDHVLSFLAEPTLRKLEIWNTENSQLELVPSLSTLRLCCNNIQSIRLHGPLSPPAFDAICSFSNLRGLYFSPGDGASSSDHSYQASLRGLGQLTSLQEITLNLGAGDYSRLRLVSLSTLFGRSSTNLSSLKRMSLSGDISSLVHIVGIVEATALQELHLQMQCRNCRNAGTHHTWGVSTGWQSAAAPADKHGQGHGECLKSTILRISKLWPTSMRSLRIRAVCSHFSAPPVVEDILLPLAELTNLRTFEFTVTPHPSATPISSDLNLHKVIPHLVKLTQLRQLYFPSGCTASLKDIHYLAFSLPSLRSLRISISLDHIPPICVLPPLPHCLETLDVDHSAPFPLPGNLRSAHLIAWNVYRMFPNITTVACDGSPTWSQVSELLSFIRDIEAQILDTPEPLRRASHPQPEKIQSRARQGTL